MSGHPHQYMQPINTRGYPTPASNARTVGVAGFPSGNFVPVPSQQGQAGFVPSPRSRGETGCWGSNCDACAGADEKGPGIMTYVGTGGGDWISETNYKYVGVGAGDFSFYKPKAFRWGSVCIFMTLVALFLMWVFTIPSTKTTTGRLFQTARASNASKECLMWGDPHARTFDHEYSSVYGAGEFWIVKNDQVKIQGRYLGTQWTHGLAATNKIAVSGPFIDNRVITVACLEDGGIEVDGITVLPVVGSTFDLGVGLGDLRYDDTGDLVDEAQSNLPRRAVHMNFRRYGVEVTVFRWKNYLDLRIGMLPMPGTDGTCGNYNGDPADDSTKSVFMRAGARVQKQELLFKHRAPVVVTVEMQEMMMAKCPETTLVRGEQVCRTQLPTDQLTTNHLNSCVYDICFGIRQHALRTVKTFPGQP